MTDNVLGITVEPKTVREQYNRHEITVGYNPTTQIWTWTFVHQMNVTHVGTGRTLQLAMKKAKEQVDIITGDSK